MILSLQKVFCFLFFVFCFWNTGGEWKNVENAVFDKGSQGSLAPALFLSDGLLFFSFIVLRLFLNIFRKKCSLVVHSRKYCTFIWTFFCSFLAHVSRRQSSLEKRRIQMMDTTNIVLLTNNLTVVALFP